MLFASTTTFVAKARRSQAVISSKSAVLHRHLREEIKPNMLFVVDHIISHCVKDVEKRFFSGALVDSGRGWRCSSSPQPASYFALHIGHIKHYQIIIIISDINPNTNHICASVEQLKYTSISKSKYACFSLCK